MLGLLLLAVAGALYQLLGTERDRQEFAPPGSLIGVGGHRLHAICGGEGTPVVVLESGIAASSLSWALVQPEVARFTRVCAYDRAGLAWSDVPSRERSFAGIVDELAAMLANVAGQEPCILVGHSFGSFVVRAYAARHPERVIGIVMLDPPTEWLTLTPSGSRRIWAGVYLSRLGALLAQLGVVRACLALLTSGAPGIPRRFAKIFGPPASRTLERLVGEVRKLPADLYPIVQAHWCQPRCFYSMADHLRTLVRDRESMARLSPPVPVVVISSRDQPPDQIVAHRLLAETSPSGRHLIAERSGHWVQLDQPDLIVDTIRQFVDSARTTSARRGHPLDHSVL